MVLRDDISLPARMLIVGFAASLPTDDTLNMICVRCWVCFCVSLKTNLILFPLQPISDGQALVCEQEFDCG